MFEPPGNLTVNTSPTQISRRAYLLDLDGVVTDPMTSQTEVLRDVMVHIASLIQRGDTVAFATGRPWKWVERIVMAPLAEALIQVDALHPDLRTVFVACENGAAICRCDFRPPLLTENALSWEHSLSDDPLFRVDPMIFGRVSAMIRDRGWGDYLVVDTDKVAMVTVYQNPAVAPEVFFRWFNSNSANVVAALSTLDGLDSSDFAFAVTSIAVDAYRPAATKRLAGLKLSDALGLSTLPRASSLVTIIGDSPSDAHIAHGLPPDLNARFIFVGSEKDQGLIPRYAGLTVTVQPSSRRFAPATATFLAAELFGCIKDK
jgi:hypothetical protein